MTESSPTPDEETDPSLRRTTIARFEDPVGGTATVVDFSKFVEKPMWRQPQRLSHVHHLYVPLKDLVLEAWATFDRDILATAVWLGIGALPMNRAAWAALVASDRPALIVAVTDALRSKGAVFDDDFAARAIDVQRLSERIARSRVVQLPYRSSHLVLSEVTAPGRARGELVPFSYLEEMLESALLLADQLRSGALSVGADSGIFNLETDYSPGDTARMTAEVNEFRLRRD